MSTNIDIAVYHISRLLPLLTTRSVCPLQLFPCPFVPFALCRFFCGQYPVRLRVRIAMLIYTSACSLTVSVFAVPRAVHRLRFRIAMLIHTSACSLTVLVFAVPRAVDQCGSGLRLHQELQTETLSRGPDACLGKRVPAAREGTAMLRSLYHY